LGRAEQARKGRKVENKKEPQEKAGLRTHGLITIVENKRKRGA